MASPEIHLEFKDHSKNDKGEKGDSHRTENRYPATKREKKIIKNGGKVPKKS